MQLATHHLNVQSVVGKLTRSPFCVHHWINLEGNKRSGTFFEFQ
jgi:hypothetical protein